MTKKGYCMKCREKGVEISNGGYRLKNGRPFYVGKHNKCGSEVWLIVSGDEARANGLKVEKSSKSRKGGNDEPKPEEPKLDAPTGGRRRKSKSRASKSKSKSKSKGRKGKSRK